MERDLKALIVLFKANRHMLSHLKKSLEGEALSVNEFVAMEAIFNKNSLTTQELIDVVLIPNSSMTYVLDTLCDKELVVRERDASDRRITRLALTDYGQKFFREIYKRHFSHMRKVFDVLTEAEEAQLKETLKKLGKHAERLLTE